MRSTASTFVFGVPGEDPARLPARVILLALPSPPSSALRFLDGAMFSDVLCGGEDSVRSTKLERRVVVRECEIGI